MKIVNIDTRRLDEEYDRSTNRIIKVMNDIYELTALLCFFKRIENMCCQGKFNSIVSRIEFEEKTSVSCTVYYITEENSFAYVGNFKILDEVALQNIFNEDNLTQLIINPLQIHQYICVLLNIHNTTKYMIDDNTLSIITGIVMTIPKSKKSCQNKYEKRLTAKLVQMSFNMLHDYTEAQMDIACNL